MPKLLMHCSFYSHTLSRLNFDCLALLFLSGHILALDIPLYFHQASISYIENPAVWAG